MKFVSIALALASSQTAPVPAPVQTATGIETRQFGDWTMRCVTREGLPPCEIVQAVRHKENEKAALEFSLAYAGRDTRYAVQLVLPLGVFVQGEALIRLDEKTDLHGYAFTRCEPSGCYIDRLVSRADLDPLFAAAKGVVAVRQSNGQPLIVPLSFNGFADAAKSMADRNTAWAKKTAPAK